MSEPTQPTYRFGRWLFGSLLRHVYRVEIHGWQNVPKSGPCLLVCNHQSFLDPALLGSSIPHRQVHFMAKKELFDHWFFSGLLKAVGCIPVDRQKGDLNALKQAGELLGRGRTVGLFPEGTRSPDNRMGPWLPGAALLALRTRAAVVPAAVVNTRVTMEERRLLPGGPPICIRFGAPLQLRPVDSGDRVSVVHALERMRESVAVTLEEMALSQPAGEQGGGCPWPSVQKEP